ncbi:hypothetical protein ACOMCW_003278 [Yersinia enterocolitica]|uniref:hypothetical protein n=1 Tax=Yersinia enterocolitica TaxID=630 RepID=UPI0029B63245|nr:hypothetical protein [Yersinia enterocolitica]HEI6814780.1 hypothetical protein [Yersinia enterocolitica]
MNGNQKDDDKTIVTFTYNDNQRADEIIALKQLIFSILRNLPYDVVISTIQTIGNKNDDKVFNRLCLEMGDAIISTTQRKD